MTFFVDLRTVLIQCIEFLDFIYFLSFLFEIFDDTYNKVLLLRGGIPEKSFTIHKLSYYKKEVSHIGYVNKHLIRSSLKNIF